MGGERERELKSCKTYEGREGDRQTERERGEYNESRRGGGGGGDRGKQTGRERREMARSFGEEGGGRGLKSVILKEGEREGDRQTGRQRGREEGTERAGGGGGMGAGKKRERTTVQACPGSIETFDPNVRP